MSILQHLAAALGRRDEVPNQELAAQIVARQDRTAIQELVENLNHKDKNIQSNCIKVLYEAGERDPALIAPYEQVFLGLLSHKNNRLIWGAMIALDAIASIHPKGIYPHLPAIMETADKGTVITKDHGVSILIKLAAIPEYADNALTLLLDQFKSCSVNQLPMYAEHAVVVVPDPYKSEFIQVLTRRMPDVDKESKARRLEKVIQKLSKSR